MKNRILFVYNSVPIEERTGIYGECASVKTVNQLHQALLAGGNEVFLLNARSPMQVIDEISGLENIDLAFVIAEGFLDEPDTLYDGSGSQKIRAVIQSQGIPTSHTGIHGMEICRNKDHTYETLRKKGIRVPGFFTIQKGDELENAFTLSGLEFPLFIKPAGGGNSVGISINSIVENMEQLKLQTISLFEELGDVTLIAETYLSGQEFTIGIMGGMVKTVLPIIAFPIHYRVRSHASKGKEYKDRDQFQILTSEDPRYWQLYDIATASFDAVEGRDIIRLEVREDAHKELYVIDVNGTPSLSESASLTYMAEYLDISFKELINMIISGSLKAHGINPSIQTEEFIDQAKIKLRAYGRIVDEAV